MQGYRKFRQVTHEASRDAIIAVKLPAPGVHSCQAPELAVVLPGGTTASWRRFLVNREAHSRPDFASGNLTPASCK